MKKIIRILVGTFAVLGVISVAMSVFLSFVPNDCRRVSLGSIASPNQTLRAEQIVSSCEKEAEVRTEVRLYKADSSNTSWGIFGVRSERLEQGSGFRPVLLEVAWLGEAELKITYPKGAHVYMRDKDVESVNVIFIESQIEPR